MTDLNEHQFEILPDADSYDGLVFGIGADVSVDQDGFVPADGDWVTQDVVNSRRGNRNFGRDVLSAGTWVWAAHVDQADVPSAVDALEQMKSAWHPEDLYDNPGSVVGLRYRLADRVRRIYGRPRQFDSPPTNLILSGYVPITMAFDLVDPKIYDDEPQSIILGMNPPDTGGGFRLPHVFPISTAAINPPAEPEQAVVGGTARAYPIIRLSGPWTNPGVVTSSWTLNLTGTIPEDVWIEIDTRPWMMTVLRSDGASVPNMLARRTWLDEIYLEPNTRPEFVLTGSTDGGAACQITWRNAWKSI